MRDKKCVYCEKTIKKENKFYCSRKCKSAHINKKNEKICANCNKIFYRKRNQLYCSQECRKKHTKKKHIKICQSCGKTFVANNSKYFCSHKCSGLANRKRIKIVCKFCGNIFERVRCEVKLYDPKFCSRKCYNDYAIKYQTRKTGKNLLIKQCQFCKKTFQVFPYRKDAMFCSNRCYDDSRRITKKCPTCKNKFTYPKWEKRVYCSTRCAIRGVQRTNGFSRSVYDAIKKEFKKRKIQKEYRILLKNKKYYVDFLISNKVCLECDGQYWHCDSRVYPAKYFHKQARKTAKEIWTYDERKEKDIKKSGYHFIRVKEYDWLKDQQQVISEIKEKIDEIFKSN